MKHKALRILLLCGVLYFIPCGLTFYIRKNIPETKSTPFDSGIYVYMETGDLSSALDLDEYLVGVVAAQIPGDYPLEAVKAQAVLARTRLMQVIGDRKGVDASLLNQSWLSKTALRKKYGSSYGVYYEKLVTAVTQTTEEVLTYEGELAMPMFFKCSNGKTRDAKEVWGKSLPYLTAVESTWDKGCDDYASEVSLSPGECIERLQESYSDFQANEESFKDTVQILEKDGSGYVLRLQMGNREFFGEDICHALGLASPSFEVRAKSKSIVFRVTGAGQGVGLSQWGARSMAEEGKKYEEILAYYFPGTQIS